MENMTQMENGRIATKTCTAWLGEDGIVRFVYVPGTDVTLEEAKGYISAYLKLSNGKKRPILVDLKNVKSFGREARRYLSGDDAENVACACALVASSPVGRILGNFYLGISNPTLPTRLFTSEDEALEWLKKHIE